MVKYPHYTQEDWQGVVTHRANMQAVRVLCVGVWRKGAGSRHLAAMLQYYERTGWAAGWPGGRRAGVLCGKATSYASQGPNNTL